MQVTFEPTNFELTFHDNFFVQLQLGDDQPITASFLDLSDAIEFGRKRMTESRFVRSFWVFSRTAQYHGEHKKDSEV